MTFNEVIEMIGEYVILAFFLGTILGFALGVHVMYDHFKGQKK